MGFCDSQKLRKGEITYFCERTGRIFRENILKYVKYTYLRISVTSQKNNFMICACIIFPSFKLIETERYVLFICVVHFSAI